MRKSIWKTERKTLGRLAMVWAAILAVAAATGCGDGSKLMVHVGGTMRPAVEDLAKAYEAKTGVKVEINSAGSGELLAHIESHKEGDLYVCHDPFLDILMKKYEMGVDGWIIGELTPVIITQKGNPKGIKGVADLARPDVDLYLTDYKYSTLGRMAGTIFSKAGIDLEELKKKKEINTNRSGGYVANAVEMKNADAAMVWRVVGELRSETVDIVPIAKEHLPEPDVDTVTSATGKDYALTPVNVTVATLTCSKQPEKAAAFAEFLASKETNALLAAKGYTVGNERKAYAAGKELTQ